MSVYIILIAYILFLSACSVYFLPETANRERFILRMGMMAIFLLLALKKETVGSDILGYKQEYLFSADVPWNNISYVYFEAGYIQLMKLFSKLGIPFQLFSAFIYAICCSAYYKFNEKYSPNATLSLLVFVCYQFLVFYISGLRQALAMAICIYAFLTQQSQWKTRWHRLIASVLIVLIAAWIHQSALLFLAVIMFIQWQPGKVHWMIMLAFIAASAVIRPIVLRFINSYIGEVQLSSRITLGGNFIFLVGLMILCIIANYQKTAWANAQNDFLPIATNILMMAVASQFLFSGSSLLRSSMYLTLFLIPGLPCALKRFERRIELLLTWFLGVFFVALFWTDTLSINQLNLCPYLFFWQ